MLATRGVLSVTVSVGYEPVPLLRRHVLRLFRRLLLVRMGHGQAIAARVHLSEAVTDGWTILRERSVADQGDAKVY